MIRRLVEWRVLPPSCVPDSCIVNIYDVDDCIPPHIDHHDFLRPFCTVSFLAECSILFGRDLRVLGPGDFSASASISLPVGSVLVLKDNGADVAKHCVPAVPAKRISITFQKMDASKRPFNLTPDTDLLPPYYYPAPLRPAAAMRPQQLGEQTAADSDSSPQQQVAGPPSPAQQQQAVSVAAAAAQYQAAVIRAGHMSARGANFERLVFGTFKNRMSLKTKS
uniref:Fe2OG dioxygenase domain-containing protein n=1 Tax=Arundo donax TaxID=35708 RepID=A0A0A9EUR3_ARUDO